jgi:hypothetical protein
MSADLETLRAKFLKAYASVPEKLRGDIIAVVEDRTYSWDAIFVEASGKTRLGDKLIKKLEEIGLFREG